MGMGIQRFPTEAEATRAAITLSLAGHEDGITIYLIESPSREDPKAGRWCLDDMGFIRSWERLVGTYENGKLVEP